MISGLVSIRSWAMAASLGYADTNTNRRLFRAVVSAAALHRSTGRAFAGNPDMLPRSGSAAPGSCSTALWKTFRRGEPDLGIALGRLERPRAIAKVRFFILRAGGERERAEFAPPLPAFHISPAEC
jgi:hypothetical protein